MTPLDILVLLLVSWFSFRGLANGFVAEALSLIAWLLAIAAVKLLHTPVAEYLTIPVGTEAGASVLAFALVFGITFLAVRAVAGKLGKVSKSSALGGFDRILGGGFGALKGLIGASVIFLVASLLHDTVYGGKSLRPQWMSESKTYPLLNATSGAIVSFIEERRKNGGAPAEVRP